MTMTGMPTLVFNVYLVYQCMVISYQNFLKNSLVSSNVSSIRVLSSLTLLGVVIWLSVSLLGQFNDEWL